MKTARIILLILSITVSAKVTAQDFVYLMPSKEIAETGEDFFFKAYLMDRQTFALSDRSQTLYLQVRSQSDSVVWSEKYPLVSGRGNGHIYIGTDWPQGEYFMEGYTKSSFSADSSQSIHPRRIRPKALHSTPFRPLSRRRTPCQRHLLRDSLQSHIRTRYSRGGFRQGA